VAKPFPHEVRLGFFERVVGKNYNYPVRFTLVLELLLSRGHRITILATVIGFAEKKGAFEKKP
jgi:hypothetical protein